MQIVSEELFTFKEKINMVVVTTNGVITKAGKLVMGRGCAKQLLLKVPGIDEEAAISIEDHGMDTKIVMRDYDGRSVRVKYTNYGFICLRNPIKTGKVGIGIFQVKECWWEDAQPWLIKLSVGMLSNFANEHPGIKIRMAFPGIGNGRLSEDVVLPLLQKLPDNVTICKRERDEA